MSQQGKVSCEIQGHLLLIGLDRTTKRNAFDSHLIHDLSLALTEYEDHPELRCAVIFAHGEHFTAGLDLVELQPKLETGIFSFASDQISPWGTTARLRKKPVIVAVQATLIAAKEGAEIAFAHLQQHLSPLLTTQEICKKV